MCTRHTDSARSLAPLAFILGLALLGVAAMPASALRVAAVRQSKAPEPQGVGAGPILEIFDASVQFTAGAFLPLQPPVAATLKYMASSQWTARARRVNRVAADGASLLLLRARVPLRHLGLVRFSVTGQNLLGDPGGLYQVTDQSLLDTSKMGGNIDNLPFGAQQLTCKTVLVGQNRYAFALYRSPRNFDGDTKITGSFNERPVQISADFATPGARRPTSQGLNAAAISQLTIVRPLVIFIHGTFSSTDSWMDFPLYENSANELHGYQFAEGNLPFQSARVSFRWLWNSTAGVQDNAMTILAQINLALADWRRQTSTAGTQADVITHSFGGLIARQVTQTQPDPNPIGPDNWRNFRAAENGGHGVYHKLITFAGSHRGSEDANVEAYLNEKGNTPGKSRELGCEFGQFVDKGAVRDQMVLSQAVRNLRQSRVPGHALVGSGRSTLDPSGTYQLEQFGIAALDSSNGPYLAAFLMQPCPYDFQANYIFNLDVNTPPVTSMGCPAVCTVDPNYDLVISAYSSQARMPDDATTTVLDLDPTGGLIGFLNHSGLISPTYSSEAIVTITSNRVQFLLTQPTTGSFFSFFPATMAEPPTALEQTFTEQFDPAWLDVGMDCPNPTVAGTCPEYTQIEMWPPQMTLTDGFPVAPLVYGLLNGQFVTAWAPGSNASTSRNCPITMTSSDPNVVEVIENTVIGQQALQPTGFGEAIVTITVEGFQSIQLPVTVMGNLVPVELVSPGGPPTFNGNRRTPVKFAFLGNQSFDPTVLIPELVRVNGLAPTPFPDGQILHFEDVNGDGRLDAVLRIAPAELQLGPGPRFIGLRGETVDGTRVEGQAFVTVK